MNTKEINNAEKFHAAMNALAEELCGVSDVFSQEQTDEMLKKQMARGESEDLVIARMCQLAYGVQNITLKDALLILDDGWRQRIADSGAALSGEHNNGKAMANMIDVLVRHWRDFDEREKKVISDAVVALERLKNDAVAAT